MQSEWIKLKDQMPNLDQEIEVRFYDGKVEKTKLIIKRYQGGGDTLFFWPENPDVLCPLASEIEYWRPLPKEEIDFSKLKEGDKVIVIRNDGDLAIGFIFEITGTAIALALDKRGNVKGYIGYKTIKNIFRINFDYKNFGISDIHPEKKFEKI